MPTHGYIKRESVYGLFLLSADESVPHERIGSVNGREDCGSVSEVTERGKSE